MRPLLLASIIALALASSAVAQEKRLNLSPPKADLRGPTSADPAQSPLDPIPVLPPVQPAAAPQDPSACRTACAQSYYFCLTGTDDQCPVRWSACVLSCNPGAYPAT